MPKPVPIYSAIRIRPWNVGEIKNNNEQAVKVRGTTEVSIHHKDEVPFQGRYDFVFLDQDELSTPENYLQDRVFDELGSKMMEFAWQGMNSTILAYGEKGSGKTFTLFGPEYGLNENHLGIMDGDMKALGLCWRMVSKLLQQINQRSDQYANERYKLEISMVELFSEKAYDVLYPKNAENKHGLTIREHPKWGPYFPQASNWRCRNMSEVFRLVGRGLKDRPSSKTLSELLKTDVDNPPAHLIFQIVLTQSSFDFSKQVPTVEMISRMTLVDIASPLTKPIGLAKLDDAAEQDLFKNHSSMTFHQVIQKLVQRSESKSSSYIPYRDSLLSHFLKESLGGNSFTIFLGHLSPCQSSFKSSIETCKLASQIMTIPNYPTVNKFRNDITEEIEENIENLQDQLNTFVVHDHQYVQVEKELKREKSLLQVLKKSPKDRQAFFSLKKRENVSQLLRSGVSISKIGELLEYDTENAPYFLRLKNHFSPEERILYFVTLPKVTIGRDHDNDIILPGKAVKLHHCHVIVNVESDKVVLSPIYGADVYRNGILITKNEILESGDRIVIGEHILQFSDNSPPRHEPYASIDLPNSLVGWEIAKRELIKKRTEVLESQIKDKEGTLKTIVEDLVDQEEKVHLITKSIEEKKKELMVLEDRMKDKIQQSQLLESKISEFQKYQVRTQTNVAVLEKDLKLKEATHLSLKSELNDLEAKKERLLIETTMFTKEHNDAQQKKLESIRECDFALQKIERDIETAEKKKLRCIQDAEDAQLATRDKSMLLQQKILEITEQQIILKQKSIETQKKAVEIQELKLEKDTLENEMIKIEKSLQLAKSKLENLKEQEIQHQCAQEMSKELKEMHRCFGCCGFFYWLKHRFHKSKRKGTQRQTIDQTSTTKVQRFDNDLPPHTNFS